MRKNKNESTPINPPVTPPPEEKLPFKERIYSKIKIPLKTLDIIIGFLIAAIIICIVVGALIGNGII